MEAFQTQLAYRRRRTRPVSVGTVVVGGDAPIRLQSMLTCSTWDVDAAIAEMASLQAAGCEIVRVTVPTQKDLDALPRLRERMTAAGLTMPVVADIHFNPRLALGCVPHVEKVRINPGNYVDQKKFKVRDYTDAEYAAELGRIEAALLPLIEALKTHRRALRVGVNHGSLSDRILNRYGDTPEGMVECAMEYLRVLRAHGFEDTIISMKSSNPQVVIQAYRLLVLRMDAEEMDYPLHLGVTEAGDGMDGRIKSAIGIGALLCDGLGDTVRVSLTEPSANEIPAARELVQAVLALTEAPAWPEAGFAAPISFARRPTVGTAVGGTPVGAEAPVAFFAMAPAGMRLPTAADVPWDAELTPPGTRGAPETQVARLDDGAHGADAAPVLQLMPDDVDSPALAALLAHAADGALAPRMVLLAGEHPLHAARRLTALLDAKGVAWPVGVLVPPVGADGMGLGAAGELGSLAADGLLDAVVCSDNDPAGPAAEHSRVLLQAARLRIYKTEYISCPSCGRTLFDLQETTERIKARTAHLPGVRIGVMGCIVNGPGEMADADFGYVGGAPGKVNLYKGQTCVARGVPTEEAVERLVDLIKAHGRWVEPPVALPA